ncbi:MAG: hypothetical protein COU81_01450 [Candidatus Portnoybacteria bacterium CG10_big_fil_rev_8_21_14_0_10_36_7]|uniref:TraC-like domain-containing protein n=1 Tax=Candidatus Portnoybacteria bacterium CG10_big_fil_rev_8_21_14_0_10_36_7 TaxID=1974812 RepID=A0A2M8KEG1_9BACT|nr:MAG: hypothetical protein COU81_01450 [Candidatus Portnoybacteria bacterium CG10_big_fil_rev_8_21_14_0_10_36_7]
MANIKSTIDINNIKNNIVVLKNGGLRSVLLASAINFALKSPEEQDAITGSYQSFLNSLDFSLQIVITSRRMDISEYLESLENKRREQPSELLRIQIAEYLDFIKNLTGIANIMNQMFYIVVPFAPVESTTGGLGKFFNYSKNNEKQIISFEESASQLWQRVNFIISGLSQVGIKAVPLNNDELAEVYYHLYNPEAREHLAKARPKQQ